jgi:hypothetical protein
VTLDGGTAAYPTHRFAGGTFTLSAAGTIRTVTVSRGASQCQSHGHCYWDNKWAWNASVLGTARTGSWGMAG